MRRIKAMIVDDSGAVKAAARANLECLAIFSTSVPPSRQSADAIFASSSAMVHTTDTVVAIGTSTGGTQVLELVLTALPKEAVKPGAVDNVFALAAVPGTIACGTTLQAV